MDEVTKQSKTADYACMHGKKELTIDDLANDPIIQDLMSNIDD